jgi:transcription elongation GreA/GreB family factor
VPLRDLNKEQILSDLITRFADQVADLTRLARETAEGATHEEARPEDSKDTRALEQTYLARGQAERVAGAERDLQMLRAVRCITFSQDDPVAATALVLIEDEHGAQKTVLLLPAAGGSKIESQGHTVQVITPHSPLGQALLEKSEGEEVEVRAGGKPRGWEIVAVS